MHRTLAKTKLKNQSNYQKGQGLERTNDFYQRFNQIGRTFAQLNAEDKKAGIPRNKMQRFNYNPKPTASEVTGQLLYDQDYIQQMAN